MRCSSIAASSSARWSSRALQTIQDLSLREIAILAPLVVITIALGVYPKPVFDVTTPAVAKLISDNKTALALSTHRQRHASVGDSWRP